MRCLIVVPSLKRAGAETQAIDLSNGLSSLGHRVSLCSFEPELDQRERIADSVSFHHLRRKGKIDLALVEDLALLIDKEGIEIVQGTMQYAALLSWMASRRSIRKPRVVAAVHTTTNRGLKEELQDRLVYRAVLRRLAAVLFVCDYQCNHWTSKFPELRRLARVVHNGVDIKRYQRLEFEGAAKSLRSRLGIADSSFVFSCVAAFRPEKNHRMLIEAFSRLPESTYLLLAGGGELQSAIKSAVDARGLTNRVRFLGVVSDIRPVVVASNATVLPSIAVETFSMAMLESMALRVPMIATEIGGLAEAITHGETGLLCTRGDLDSLVHQMKYLTDHPAEALRLGEAAAEKICRCFTLDKMVLEIASIFDELLTSAGVAVR